ncbi:unnamed protein product [Blepharisma stoltei]|uniref:Uncharacterized protein n=1 Tax=Blepharisma stoltei TaxID=1481888 RepID=A0AAU9KED8_9CILI|nr:unnamed protein product [Blepharisma stoltei]
MWGFPFCLKYPSGCPFSQSDTNLSEILTNIQITALALRNPKFSDILSQEFKDLLYKNNPEFSKDCFAFGTYSAQNSLTFEMHAHAYVSSPPAELLTFMWDTLYIADFYDRSVAEIDDYSKSVINNQMSIIANSLTGFILCTFVAYIGFYLPFFKYEKKYLQKINSILKIIPNK